MDLDALAAELTNDPLTRGYSGMTDGEAAESLNAVNRRGVANVADLTEHALIANVFQRCKREVRRGTDAALHDLAEGFIATLAHYQTINFADATRYAVLDAQLSAMVSASLMTADDKAAFLAFGENQQSRAREIGLPLVRWHHVEKARA